jgi:sulfur carrier protein
MATFPGVVGTSGIRIEINGETREVPVGLSVEQLLEHLDLHPRMVVVEHNAQILRREAFASTTVAAGDTLELVHFVGGG